VKLQFTPHLLALTSARGYDIGDDAWALLDFEYAGYGWRVFDIATFFSNQLTQRGRSEHTRGLLDTFLDGYQSERPLSAAELVALPAFVTLRQL